MPLLAASNATLRTKTGCWTCRARKKKCNEQRPRCEKCVKSKRVCSWPSEDELLDNRNRRSPKSPRLRTVSSPKPAVVQRRQSDTKQLFRKSEGCGMVSLCREICVNSDVFNAMVFKSDLEAYSFRHFLSGFLPMQFLCNAHPGFLSQLIPEMVEMLSSFVGMKYVMMACGASHMHYTTGSSQMYKEGLRYYCRAVSEVTHALSETDWSQGDFNDGVLWTIMLLYVHGVYSIETNRDIAKHVEGAAQMVKLRMARSSGPRMLRATDRIMWESILYQSFRQAVNRPFVVDFQPDSEFCTIAENILQSLTFPDLSPGENSPIIGLPLRLPKFIIEIVQLCKSPYPSDAEALQRLKSEMNEWERAILEEGHCSKESDWPSAISERCRLFNLHSMSLHVLAASLLLEWVSKAQEVLDEPPRSPRSPKPSAGDSWQLRRGLEILRCPHASKEWTRCFLGSWPTLIFGYAVDTPEDAAFLRGELERRFYQLYSGEEILFMDELESVWRMKGLWGEDVE